MSAPQAGDRINNYLLEAPIGCGTFGTVWRARHHVFGDLVAIKIPTDPQYVRNLQREGVAIHGLRHPNIVRALDLDPYADPPYLIMEYVPGPTLRAVIDNYPDGLPLGVAVMVFRGLLNAVLAAHGAGVVHRDIKPANILLALDAVGLSSVRPDQVRVTDFGLGKVCGLTTHTILQSGSLVTAEGQGLSGTIAYMSPEQRDGKDVDHRSDVYACGIVLFEMITGQRPQGSDLPSHIRPEVPAALDEIFKRCHTRVDRRYDSAEDILHDLAAAAKPSGPTADPRGITVARARRCGSCGCELGDDAQFCTHCGRQQVAHVPRCPSCRAYAYATDNFCIACGTLLRASPAGV